MPGKSESQLYLVSGASPLTLQGLRLTKAFFEIRNPQHREQVIALAERLLEEQNSGQAVLAD